MRFGVLPYFIIYYLFVSWLSCAVFGSPGPFHIVARHTFQVADLYLLPFFAAHKLHHFCQFATITGRDEHVPTVETLIQTVIERVQAIANELPFETYSHWLIM